VASLGKMRPMTGTRRAATLRSALAGLACLALASVALGEPAGAQQDPPPQGSADVRAGTCAEPGDVVALLEPVPSDVSGNQGPAIATSVTQVALPFTELTGEPHIIAVEGGTGALCATVSGPLAEDGGLASALVDADGQAAGIAWLRELGLEATTVHIFLLADHMGPLGASPGTDASPGPNASPGPRPSPGPSPSPDPSPSPAASPSSEDGVLPDGEIDPREDIDVDVGY
jgi:hypothetical protein